jgi:hypothetical protein
MQGNLLILLTTNEIKPDWAVPKEDEFADRSAKVQIAEFNYLYNTKYYYL